jgi:hypothetical protein
MYDRAFVGGDGVGPHFQRRAEVIKRRLTGLRIEGGSFKQDAGARGGQPLVKTGSSDRGVRIASQEAAHIKAFRVDQPAKAARGQASDAPVEVILFVQYVPFFLKPARQSAAHVAEAEEAEVEVFHVRSGEGCE